MAMFSWLLLSNAAVNAINDDQGIDSLDEFKLLADEDVSKLCKVVRRPGSSIINPSAADAGQPPTLPSVGTAILITVDQNLKLAMWEVCMCDRISRTVAPASITHTTIDAIHENKEEGNANHKDPTQSH